MSLAPEVYLELWETRGHRVNREHQGAQVCQGSGAILDSMDFQVLKERRVTQDFRDQLDLQGKLGQKDHLVSVETLAQLRSSPFQEAQGHLAVLEDRGCQENQGHQGHQES